MRTQCVPNAFPMRPQCFPNAAPLKLELMHEGTKCAATTTPTKKSGMKERRDAKSCGAKNETFF